jgi:hypothetical protein
MLQFLSFVEDKLCTIIPAAVFRVHSRLGPSPLESGYSPTNLRIGQLKTGIKGLTNG